MKVTFIRPNMGAKKSKDAMQPLVFAILSALTPEYIERELFDDRIEEIDFSTKTDLVAISVETFTAKRAYQISEKFRNRGIPVIMGGFHATALPEEILQNADSVVIGDADPIWTSVIHDLEKGRLKNKYQAKTPNYLISQQFDRHIFSGKKYNKIHLVQWARGCIHKCDFCSIAAYYNGYQYYRKIEDVVLEIKKLPKNLIFFTDDNLFHTKKIFEFFLENIIPLNITWVCQITLEVTNFPEIVKLMKKSGCLAVVVGIESVIQESLSDLNKKWNKNEENISNAINIFRENGIMIYGSFVFGTFSDTLNNFSKAINFAKNHKLFIANFNILNPIPGTKLYNSLKESNKLIYRTWWLDDNYFYGKSAFIPQNYSVEELENSVYLLKRKFNSISSILFRFLDRKANMISLRNAFVFWLANLTNRLEIKKKQGVKFGELK